ncbi:MAG: hypothetical protein ABIK89_04330 [Planctomycetota bacterium]
MGRKRVPLFDEDGERIRGNEGKEAAELALARERLTWEDEGHKTPNGDGPWLVVRVCSEYIQYCERGVTSGTISEGHRNNAASWLNDRCSARTQPLDSASYGVNDGLADPGRVA